MQSVQLKRCDGYDSPEFSELIASLMADMTGDWSIQGSTILVKPNLISHRAPKLACSRPEVIVAVVHWLLDRGAKVRVGDSPAFGSSTSVLRSLGIDMELGTAGAEIVDFRTAVNHTLECGVDVGIAAEALENDYLVNLPRLKAHNQMYLTGAVKNLFGTVVGVRKAMLHMRHGNGYMPFSRILNEIPGLLPPHVTMLDGVEVMSGSGPVDGVPLDLNLLAGSACPVSLDTALLGLLQLPCEQSPLWSAAHEADHPGCRSGNHFYPDLQPQDFYGSGFLAPAELNPVRFSLFRSMRSGLRRLSLAFR
jgi:uncharacterized protein (DUF362 family)